MILLVRGRVLLLNGLTFFLFCQGCDHGNGFEKWRLVDFIFRKEGSMIYNLMGILNDK
jgi:hypothetical protein